MSCSALHLKLLSPSERPQFPLPRLVLHGFAVMFLLTLIVMHLFNLPCSW